MKLVNNYTGKYLIPCSLGDDLCTAVVVIVEPKKWAEFVETANYVSKKHGEDFAILSFEVEAYFIDDKVYDEPSWVESTENELASLVFSYNRVILTNLNFAAALDLCDYIVYIEGTYKYSGDPAISINFDFEKVLNEANQTI